MNNDEIPAALNALHDDVDNDELWLPDGTLFSDEAAERYGDIILERARVQLEQERLTSH
jgi:hypothetical protein